MSVELPDQGPSALHEIIRLLKPISELCNAVLEGRVYINGPVQVMPRRQGHPRGRERL